MKSVVPVGSHMIDTMTNALTKFFTILPVQPKYI